MLHLIFQSPIDKAVLERMAEGDAAVFLESAVLGVLQKSQLADVLTEKMNTNTLYILSEDMQVRGIQASEIVPGLTVIDYPGLVNLTVAYPQIASWC